MKFLFRKLRKPIIWKSILVLSVFGLNLSIGSGWAQVAFWSFFSLIIVLCLRRGNQNRITTTARYKKFEEERIASRRRMFGSRNIYSIDLRKKTLGY